MSKEFNILSYLTSQALIAQLVEQLICNHFRTQSKSKNEHKIKKRDSKKYLDYRWTTEDVIDSIDQDNKFFTYKLNF